MRESVIILAWWVAFGGTHILLSSNLLRPKLVGALGDKPFMGLYSLISFATIIPLFWTYLDNRHAGPQLWYLPPGTRHAAMLCMALGLVCLGAGITAPSPSSLLHKSEGPATARGITRITRHPISVAFFMFGLAHCLMLGFYSDLAFFGGFCVFARLSSWHQDARMLDRVPGYARFRAETSWFPFGAVVLGRQSPGTVLREMPWVGMGLGLALLAGLVVGHEWLIGVALF